MQGTKHKMPGFSDGQCQADGFQVSQLTHQHNIWVFPQSRAQSLAEAQRIAVHFALINQAFFALVNKFNGVFDSEYMVVTIFVDVVHHGGQSCGLARTCGAGNQYQPPRKQRNLSEHIAHTQLFKCQHIGGNGAKYSGGAAVLIKNIDPKAGHTWHLEGKVGLEKFFVVPSLLVIHYFVDQTVDLAMLHRGQIDTAYIAVNSDNRWQTGRNM